MYRIISIKPAPRFLVNHLLFSHAKSCPQSKPKTCPGSGGGKAAAAGGGGGAFKKPDFQRAERSAPVRFGFLPDEWFTFFHSQTGVSGPYVFGIVFLNYMFSKEIYVMEHEYYGGLSIALMLYIVTTKFGKDIGKSLDDTLAANAAVLEAGRKQEMDVYENAIKEATLAQKRAQGQKMLMDAKKENIAMQIEAAYRERMMYVYRSVRGRMDYHLKRYRAEARIHQRWMISWILDNVRKSITPEFEKQALDSAIRDLAAAAGRA